MPNESHTPNGGAISTILNTEGSPEKRDNQREPMMTSLEISDLVGARHDSARRTIERLAEKAVIQLPPLVEIATGARAALVYVFSGEQGKRDSYVVVAQLSPEFTARLVDRWQELEARPAMDPAQVLNDPAAMRGLLLSYTEKVIALQNANAELAPKAEALDLLSASDGSVTFTQASKLLGMKIADLTRWMNASGWIYRQNGSWVAFRQHIQNGRLEYKEANYTDQKTGMACRKPYCHITPKGLARLAIVFGASIQDAA